MRKFSVYAAATMTAMTMLGAVPMTAYGANLKHVTVITGSKGGFEVPELPMSGASELLQQICPKLPGDSQLPGLPELPDMPQQPGEASFAQQVVELVNEERAKAGLSPLTVNRSAAAAAEIRSRELRTSFSHTRPNGKNFDSALREAGVSFLGAGENIAYGQRTPQEVMNAWMNSAGHRANILNEDFTEIGVGSVTVGGVSYWTQLFIY